MFPQEIVEVVKALTKEDYEPYEEYLYRVRENQFARIVKLCDLEHNMDISRIKNPLKRDYDRLEKYRKAVLFLQEKY